MASKSKIKGLKALAVQFAAVTGLYNIEESIICNVFI